MEINDLIAALTEGLPTEQASVVKAAIERDAVKSKAAGWKQQAEFDQLQARTQAMQEELEGKDGQLGYKTWYAKNYPAVVKLQKDLEEYQKKYGTLEAPIQQTQQTQQTVPSMTPEQIQAEVDKRIRENYSPKWSGVVITTGNILQKHILAGRKTTIDFDKLAQEANAKYEGNLERAYEEWDKPEREKVETKAREDEINRRVQEEVQKRQSSQYFPVKEENPGALGSRTKDEVSKFDKTALTRDLVSTFVGAGESVQ